MYCSSFIPVLDDEDSNNITVGSLVTVLVTLTRQTMAVSINSTYSLRLTVIMCLSASIYSLGASMVFCKCNYKIKIFKLRTCALDPLYISVSE